MRGEYMHLRLLPLIANTFFNLDLATRWGLPNPFTQRICQVYIIFILSSESATNKSFFINPIIIFPILVYNKLTHDAARPFFKFHCYFAYMKGKFVFTEGI